MASAMPRGGVEMAMSVGGASRVRAMGTVGRDDGQTMYGAELGWRRSVDIGGYGASVVPDSILVFGWRV